MLNCSTIAVVCSSQIPEIDSMQTVTSKSSHSSAISCLNGVAGILIRPMQFWLDLSMYLTSSHPDTSSQEREVSPLRLMGYGLGTLWFCDAYQTVTFPLVFVWSACLKVPDSNWSHCSDVNYLQCFSTSKHTIYIPSIEVSCKLANKMNFQHFVI